MAVSFKIFYYSPVAHALRHYLVPNGSVDSWENHKGPLALFDCNVRLFVTAQVGWLAFAHVSATGGSFQLTSIGHWF
jgi:hypothetical protein